MLFVTRKDSVTDGCSYRCKTHWLCPFLHQKYLWKWIDVFVDAKYQIL